MTVTFFGQPLINNERLFLTGCSAKAERDSVEIAKVYFDPTISACRKKYPSGINAMRATARKKEFDILYVHKVDRLAGRLE